MIQFIEPTDGTRTYDRNHKNVAIKSYDATENGNRVFTVKALMNEEGLN